MNASITFTPQQVYTMLMGICGAIITVSSAIAVIANIVKKAKSPDVERDKKITELQDKVAEHDKKFEEQAKYFQNDKNRFEQIEFNACETNRVIIETLQALVEHARHGNNIEQLDKANKDLNEYLLKR